MIEFQHVKTYAGFMSDVEIIRTANTIVSIRLNIWRRRLLLFRPKLFPSGFFLTIWIMSDRLLTNC